MNKNISLIIKCDPTEEARQRRAKGMSYREIGRELDIPPSSVRNMVKDIKLTNEQKFALLSKKRKKSRKVIKLNYKNENIIINGKIDIRSTKRKRFNNDLDELITKYILDQLL